MKLRNCVSSPSSPPLALQRPRRGRRLRHRYGQGDTPRSTSASSIWASAGSPGASTTSPARSPSTRPSPKASKVKVEINTDSVNSNHAERDKHLRGKDFLNTAQIPQGHLREHGRQARREQGDYHRQLDAARGDQADRDRGRARRRRRGPVGRLPRGFHRNHAASRSRTSASPLTSGPAAKEVELTLNIEGVRQ